MDPTNMPAPPQRVIRNAAHFHQLEAEDRAAALNGDNAGNCNDFPEDDAGQVALVDQMLEAMANTDGIIDNDLDNNADVKAIRDLPRSKQERMAWKAMFKVADVQHGLNYPDVVTARFPSFMARWKAILALVRSSKAGATQFFAVPYLDRYIANPIMELDIKVSNNNTNRNKEYNTELKGAKNNGRRVTQHADRADIWDASGELVKTVMKPRKRLLSEFLEPELLQLPAAKVKRQRGSRWGTGVSASPVATSVAPVNGGQPAEGPPIDPLLAIQEEEKPGEPVQANPTSNPAVDHPSATDHISANLYNIELVHASHHHTHQAPTHQNSTGLNGSQHPYEAYNHGNMASSRYPNILSNSIRSRDNDSDNSIANRAGSNSMVSDSMSFISMASNPSGMSYTAPKNSHRSHIPDGSQSYQTMGPYPPHNPFGTVAGWAAAEQAPMNPSGVSFSGTIDPSLENYPINVNGCGSQSRPGGSAGNKGSGIPQPNSAGANLLWLPDEAADERQ